MVDDEKLDRISGVIRERWPEQVHHEDLQEPALIGEIERARAALLQALGLDELA